MVYYIFLLARLFTFFEKNDFKIVEKGFFIYFRALT